MCIRSDNSYPLLRVYLLLDSIVILHSFRWFRNAWGIHRYVDSYLFQTFADCQAPGRFDFGPVVVRTHTTSIGGTVIDDHLRTDNDFRRCTDHVFKTRQSVFRRSFALAVSKFDGTSVMLMFGRSQIYVRIPNDCGVPAVDEKTVPSILC